MATDLVMKVKADVKDASKALQGLGYDVEIVETKTKKVKEETSAWDKALHKATEDNSKNLVNMAAKVLTVATAMSALKKGIKECVDEAMKQDSVAGERLKSVQSVWSQIKADFGKGLLDTISPALETLYGWLLKIEEEVARMSTASGISSSLLASYKSHRGDSGYHTDFSDQTTVALENALNSMSNSANPHGDSAATTWAKAQIQWELDYRRDNGGASSPGMFSTGAVPVDGAPAVVETSSTSASSVMSYAEHMKKRAEMDAIRNGSRLNWGVWEETADQKAAREAREKEEKEAEEARLKEEAREKEHLEKMAQLREDYYSDLRSMGMESIYALTGAYTQSLQNQMMAVERSTMSEEDKNRKMNELAEKQFNAERLNSAASVTMSTAESIMNIWSKYGSNPTYATVLTGLASAAGAVQLGTIASQQYTPFSAGGIVSSPTHALIGEGGEKEAVMPLSKLKDFVQPQPAGSISITVNVSDGGRKDEVADAVFYAIERAQRTGALPRWRYAS